jgi:hypothetical protein
MQLPEKLSLDSNDTYNFVSSTKNISQDNDKFRDKYMIHTNLKPRGLLQSRRCSSTGTDSTYNRAQLPVYWKFMKKNDNYCFQDNRNMTKVRMQRIAKVLESSKSNSLSIENIDTNYASQNIEESIEKFYGHPCTHPPTSRPNTNKPPTSPSPLTSRLFKSRRSSLQTPLIKTRHFKPSFKSSTSDIW